MENYGRVVAFCKNHSRRDQLSLIINLGKELNTIPETVHKYVYYLGKHVKYKF